MPREPAVTAKVFVFGTGRSGTHSAVALLDALPKTLSLHEGRGVLPSGERCDLGNLMGLNVLLNRGTERSKRYRETLVPAGMSLAVMERAFRSRHEMISRCAREGVHYCDVNRMAYNYINYVHLRYPEAKFIHLVRNGYTCVRSWYGRIGAYPEHRDLRRFRMRQLKRRYLERKPGGTGCLDLLYNTYLESLLRSGSESERAVRAFAALSGRFQHLEKPRPLEDDPSFGSWKGFNRLQKLAWFWAWINDSIRRRLEAVPERNRLTLRLEDLAGDTVAKLVEFTGIPGDYAVPERSHRGRSVEYAMDWDDTAVRQFNAVAGSSMAGFGYELLPAPAP
jgi:hypothetical protein